MKCGECGGLSFYPGPSSGWRIVGSVAGSAFIPVLIGAAMITGSLWAPAVVVVAFLALHISYEIALYRQPLVPTTAEAASESRKWSRNFAAVLLLGSAALVLIALVKYAV